MIRLLSVLLASTSLLLASCASTKKDECSMCSADPKTADCCSKDKAAACCDSAAPAAKAKHKH